MWLYSSLAALRFLLQLHVVVLLWSSNPAQPKLVQGQFGLPKPILKTHKVTIKILAAEEEEDEEMNGEGPEQGKAPIREG